MLDGTALEGTLLGLVVSVGVPEGTALGKLDGASLGVWVMSLGLLEGTALGKLDGVLLGPRVSVGTLDGWELGERDGAPLGAFVAAWVAALVIVGDMVPAGDERSVGTEVCFVGCAEDGFALNDGVALGCSDGVAVGN